ncbi:MAG TPA: hypothetical protein VE863_13950 [Pyrinomonadaceae bacterium]|jgi:hypothetical protein|nr:hypothetical protein [Pyrinomonadaceae bacterium]
MNRKPITLLLFLPFFMGASLSRSIFAQRLPLTGATAAVPPSTATVDIPLAAPGVVALMDSGSGALSQGTYRFGVVAVTSDGGEGQFDPLGYSGGNAITIRAMRQITVSWLPVAGAAKYHLYVWGPGAKYYQRFYETTATSYTVTTKPAGPVGLLAQVNASDIGGNLRAGNYYFAVSAEFSNGGTVDQTNYTQYPVASIHTDTGSVSLSWQSLVGATSYRVYVISEQDGSPRTHTKYFLTTSNAVTVTGNEKYLRGTEAHQMHGDGEVESSAVGIFGSIRTISNSKSFFAADIQIAGDKNSDASFQANRFSNAAFAGLSVREANQEKWSFGLNGASRDLITTGPGGELMRLDIKGNLNIGTTAPINSEIDNTKLTIGGDIQLQARAKGPSFGPGSGGIAYRQTGERFSDPAFVFRGKGYVFENTTPEWMMVIRDNGNVGIGIVSTQPTPYPEYKLDVQGGDIRIKNGNGASTLRIDGSGNGADSEVALFEGGAPRWAAGITPSLAGNPSDYSVTRFANGVWTNALTVKNSDGNVGIGTTSPTSRLQVVGLPIFKNNAEAIAGGLTVGAFYRTGGDPDLVAVVH